MYLFDDSFEFLNNIAPDTKKYVIQTYYFLENEVAKRQIQPSDMIENLLNNKVDMQTAILVVGLVLGSFITGSVHTDSLNMLKSEYIRCYSGNNSNK